MPAQHFLGNDLSDVRLDEKKEQIVVVPILRRGKLRLCFKWSIILLILQYIQLLGLITKPDSFEALQYDYVVH